jgi:hypothetical protein
MSTSEKNLERYGSSMFQSDMVLLRRRQYKIIGLSYLIA